MSDTYEKLTAPFAQTFKKPGSNLDYITGEQVTSRLNEELGWDGWSFRVLEHGYNEGADEFWCLGELTSGSVIRQQFGSQKPNRYARGDNAGKIIDLGFDLKGAATDALKKCASLIGVGLYLHEKEPTQARKEAPPSSPVTQEAFDSQRLFALMAEHSLTGADLVRVTGAGKEGKPQVGTWIKRSPENTIDKLIAEAKRLKEQAA